MEPSRPVSDTLGTCVLEAIPSLVVLDPERRDVVSLSGRDDVIRYGFEAYARWSGDRSGMR